MWMGKSFRRFLARANNEHARVRGHGTRGESGFDIRLAFSALEQAAKGQEGELLEDGVGGEIGFVDDFVDGGGFVADLSEDELLAVGEIRWGRGDFFWRGFRWE